jgi:ubiquinone/menaquinone biosynthesis C-methylase UbiE
MTAPREKPDSSPIARWATWFIHLFFQLLYHQFAWAYDIVAWTVSLGLWNHWVKTTLNFIDGSLVLELGHGPGHLQATLHQMDIPCIGIDQSPQMSRQALRRLRRLHIRPALTNGLVQRLPFPPNKFSQIVATFPSEYIVDHQTLAEIFRVLVPGGSAIILMYAWITGKKVFVRFSAWLFRVTGESPIWKEHFLEPALSTGFITQTKQVDLPTSKLLYIILQKPPMAKHLTMS